MAVYVRWICDGNCPNFAEETVTPLDAEGGLNYPDEWGINVDNDKLLCPTCLELATKDLPEPWMAS